MLSRGEKVLPCLLGVSPRSISPAEGEGGGEREESFFVVRTNFGIWEMLLPRDTRRLELLFVAGERERFV